MARWRREGWVFVESRLWRPSSNFSEPKGGVELRGIAKIPWTSDMDDWERWVDVRRMPGVGVGMNGWAVGLSGFAEGLDVPDADLGERGIDDDRFHCGLRRKCDDGREVSNETE